MISQQDGSSALNALKDLLKSSLRGCGSIWRDQDGFGWRNKNPAAPANDAEFQRPGGNSPKTARSRVKNIARIARKVPNLNNRRQKFLPSEFSGLTAWMLGLRGFSGLLARCQNAHSPTPIFAAVPHWRTNSSIKQDGQDAAQESNRTFFDHACLAWTSSADNLAYSR